MLILLVTQPWWMEFSPLTHGSLACVEVDACVPWKPNHSHWGFISKKVILVLSQKKKKKPATSRVLKLIFFSFEL